MDSDARAARAASFGAVADDYERARPDYPEEAVAWLAGEPPRDVVDLGAGTGKLTRQLVAAGHRVVAVDPSEQMLARLEAATLRVRALVGSAERIPLADASADAVTVAQAFHWFDHAVALPEIARVLRRGGTLGLVWNMRDEAVPWVAQLSRLLGNERLTQFEIEAAIGGAELFGSVERASFRHAQRLDRELLLALVSSRSFCATREPAERGRILAAVGRLFDAVSASGTVALPYVTEAFRASRRRP